jgi:hypothetical protein
MLFSGFSSVFSVFSVVQIREAPPREEARRRTAHSAGPRGARPNIPRGPFMLFGGRGLSFTPENRLVTAWTFRRGGFERQIRGHAALRAAR